MAGSQAVYIVKLYFQIHLQRACTNLQESSSPHILSRSRQTFCHLMDVLWYLIVDLFFYVSPVTREVEHLFIFLWEIPFSPFHISCSYSFFPIFPLVVCLYETEKVTYVIWVLTLYSFFTLEYFLPLCGLNNFLKFRMSFYIYSGFGTKRHKMKQKEESNLSVFSFTVGAFLSTLLHSYV